MRNVIGVVKAAPELATKVVKMRQLGQMMLDKFAGKAIHPIAGVVGGFAKPMVEAERRELLEGTTTLFDFACFAFDFATTNVFAKYIDTIGTLGVIKTGFLSIVDRDDGSFRIYDGKQRLMKAEGSYVDFEDIDYADYLGEHVEPWVYAKMPYAKFWGEGFGSEL